MSIRAGILAAILLISRPVVAQLSDQARISLITVYPGDQVYSLFGHSAIRVHDPLMGIDYSFNYGTFDFDTWFVFKFVYGKLDYMLDVHHFDRAFEHYRDVERRSVVEQVLDLAPAERDSLYSFLAFNARPENKYYRYDFLFDNCSTRIRDALERIVGVRFSESDLGGPSFRDRLDPYLTRTPFLDVGISWLFGSPVDRDATSYQAMFLPLGLMDEFERAALSDSAGTRPLVAQTDTLFWTGEGVPKQGRAPWAIIAAWLFLAGGLFVTYRASRSGRAVIRSFDVALFALIGIAGVLIVFLWFISLHHVTEWNWHLLWSWPAHLAVAVMLIRKSPSRRLLAYFAAASAATVLAVLTSPIWLQEIHPALYPIALLAALRSGWIALSSRQKAIAA